MNNTEIKRMPVVFSGHGSPMIAIEHNDITEGMASVGRKVLEEYGRPKAILAISAHWFSRGTFIQSQEEPRQIYDMYGFPEELYQVKYPVSGSKELTSEVENILGEDVSIDDSWGIDHGTWTVLVHMFPDARIPVVQLSVNSKLNAEQSYEMGRKLKSLRDKGYLILGSGNVVHNLRMTDWDNPGGTPMTVSFNDRITEAVEAGDFKTVVDYNSIEYASYAVPTPDHFLPLLYCLGAGEGDEVETFNKVCNLGSMAMTGCFFK